MSRGRLRGTGEGRGRLRGQRELYDENGREREDRLKEREGEGERGEKEREGRRERDLQDGVQLGGDQLVVIGVDFTSREVRENGIFATKIKRENERVREKTERKEESTLKLLDAFPVCLADSRVCGRVAVYNITQGLKCDPVRSIHQDKTVCDR